jgi:hypothetical protein
MKKLALLLLLAPGALQAQTALPLPPGYPTLLGESCGGVHVSSYVTGFDVNGNITGEVYAWTSCGGSGRGGGYHNHIYQSWNSILWDLFTNYKLVPYDNVLPDPSFTAVDPYGNTILNSCSGTTNGQPACTAEANIVYIPPGTGPVSTTVPSLSGMTGAQAHTALKAVGLAESAYYQTSTTALFHVCGQSPAAGTVIDPGSTVSVCISLGTPNN